MPSLKRPRPQSSDDVVQALTVVVQHSTPAALEELRVERDRLARELEQVQSRIQTAQARYLLLRENVWRLANRFFAGLDGPQVVLEGLIAEVVVGGGRCGMRIWLMSRAVMVQSHDCAESFPQCDCLHRFCRHRRSDSLRVTG